VPSAQLRTSPGFGTGEQIWDMTGSRSKNVHPEENHVINTYCHSCTCEHRAGFPVFFFHHKRNKMALDTFVDEAKKQISENGFFMMEDPEIGSSIEEMKAKQLSFDFSEEAGFDFCRERVLLNSVSLYSYVMIQI
jgi:hypothetical protein